MQITTGRRVAAVVLTAVLLTVAGQGAAVAGDPQWESVSQGQAAPPSATQP